MDLHGKGRIRDMRRGESEERSDDDLRFGGWRDWLLLVLGLPVFVTALFAAVALGVGAKSGSWTVPSLATAVVLVAIAVAAGLLRSRDRG